MQTSGQYRCNQVAKWSAISQDQHPQKMDEAAELSPEYRNRIFPQARRDRASLHQATSMSESG
jgi:hypothetical protein